MAVFTKQAQFEGVQGNLRADRIELLLAPKDNTLERLQGRGSVTAVVETRHATGQSLTYHPARREVRAGRRAGTADPQGARNPPAAL